MVPSMLLQPLVENSIKHGLSSKIDGGSIFLRSQLSDEHVTIEVEDDGVGMASAQLLERPSGLGEGGIGMAKGWRRMEGAGGGPSQMTIGRAKGPRTRGARALGGAAGRGPPRTALRGPSPPPPVKILVLGNDFVGAESSARGDSAIFSH